ncbi:hypothetical protein TS85_15105 [Sphingomonas hengshuiensis]|uniref:N-acetyltransferase domain-containing protein n=1 Tax=Sphingomonas hengshuiensis TaxID=1609977 RepID=A0A7U4J9N9_9SPHN|nr:hypothetical protein TS85_15105 [Sphingomonas hengshuiensis]
MAVDSLLSVPASWDRRGVTLRPAGPGDAAFLRDVYVAGRWNEVAVTGWPEETVLAFLHDQYRLQTAHYATHYAEADRLVVEQDGVPAGKLILFDMQSETRVVDIGLLPAFRGRGIGALLLGWVQDAARTRGAKVSLHVEPHNPAKRLYRRLGFDVVASRGVYELLEWTAPPGDC